MLRRVAVLLLVPAVATFLIFRFLPVSNCFTYPIGPPVPSEIEEYISDKLERNYNRLRNLLGPIVEFADGWFKYDIEVENGIRTGLRIANVFDTGLEAASTSLTLWGGERVPLTYKNSTIIAEGIAPSELKGLLQGVSFSPPHIPKDPVPPGALLEFYVDDNSYLCIITSLQKGYAPQIYLVLLLFWIGLIVLAREALLFARKPWKQFFLDIHQSHKPITKKGGDADNKGEPEADPEHRTDKN